MIISNKKLITSLLTSYPELRDNDRKLCLAVWAKEMKEKGYKSFSEGYKRDLTLAESIRRTRQKIQEYDESLRGKGYDVRAKLEKEVKKEIVNYSLFDNW